MGNDITLEDLRGEIRDKYPPEVILAAFRSGRKANDVVLAAAAVCAEELAPPLLDAIARVADATAVEEGDIDLAFYGLHILGGARDRRLFPLLLRIMRLPSEPLDLLLGYAITETLKRIAIGTFDGSTADLLDLIADRETDEYVRLAMFGTLAYLVFESRVDIEEAEQFLVRFDDQRLAPAQDMAWSGWETAIALLGLREMVPRVQAAWREGRMVSNVSEPKYFFRDLKRAETQWSDGERFKGPHQLGYIEDIVDELTWADWHRQETDNEDESVLSDRDSGFGRDAPYVNPLRHVGRNDPCPCGSGKKAKRCCLVG
jgi:hypothetical protein